MLLVIRISGIPETDTDVEETLFRMRLRRKYSAILLKETKENMGALIKVRSFVAYGPVNSETLQLLLEKRGVPLAGKKLDAGKVLEGLDKKNLEQLGVKPFFRLHPPRGGIDSKIHFGRKHGVLGNNKEAINDLVRRML